MIRITELTSPCVVIAINLHLKSCNITFHVINFFGSKFPLQSENVMHQNYGYHHTEFGYITISLFLPLFA